MPAVRSPKSRSCWSLLVVALGASSCAARGEPVARPPETAESAAPASAPAPPAFAVVPSACGAAFDAARIRVEGRTEAASGGLRFAWSGTTFSARFTGTGVAVDLEDGGRNRYHVIVDGKLAPEKLVPQPGRHCYELASGLGPGEHQVELYRLTEPLNGESAFFGFTIAQGGQLLPPPAPASRRIEIIGDSISTAYGVEGETRDCPFSPDTQNHALSYGALLAERFGAELSTVAWSGKGVFSNRGSTVDTVTMPLLWERALPENAQSRWDFSRFEPDAVLIALGTNDFAPETQDKTPFGRAYLELVRKVRKAHPRALIVCTIGPMLSDVWPPETQARSTVRKHLSDVVAELEREGDRRVVIFEHATSSEAEGFGCDWHPNRTTQRRMADELAPFLAKQLGW